MAYVDLNTIHTPTTGGKPPASYGAQIRDNFEDLHPDLQTWTPTVAQGATSNITKTVTRADYVQIGS